MFVGASVSGVKYPSISDIITIIISVSSPVTPDLQFLIPAPGSRDDKSPLPSPP